MQATSPRACRISRVPSSAAVDIDARRWCITLLVIEYSAKEVVKVIGR